jgi:hypothetical protein
MANVRDTNPNLLVAFDGPHGRAQPDPRGGASG